MKERVSFLLYLTLHPLFGQPVDTGNISYYYKIMACVCSQYDVRSGWPIVTELQGIILP